MGLPYLFIDIIEYFLELHVIHRQTVQDLWPWRKVDWCYIFLKSPLYVNEQKAPCYTEGVTGLALIMLTKRKVVLYIGNLVYFKI
jgi:hypothetical protein